MSPAIRSFPWGACAPGVGAELELGAELVLGAELELGAELVELFDAAGAGLPDDPQAATERAAAAVTAKMAYRMYFTLITGTGDALRRRWESAV
jgi:hypothetical protein